MQGIFPKDVPEKKIVNKDGTTKKCIVYSFDPDSSITLKFIACQLYAVDDYFADNCYAFRRKHGVVDLSAHTVEKAKARIRRKAKALMRWQRKKGLTADKAAKVNYRISYETLKDWGYCSMVNAYYKKDMY